MSRIAPLPRNVACLLLALSGVSTFKARRRRRRGDYRLFILEYHDIVSDLDEREGAVGVSRFRKHLRFLSRTFEFETLSTAVELLEDEQRLNSDRIVITFDDGYRGNFDFAWPALKDASIPATVFLTTSFLDGGELWFDFARRALTALRRQPAPAGFATAAQELGIKLGDHVEANMTRLKYFRPKQREACLQFLRSLKLVLAPAAQPLSWDQVRLMGRDGCEFGCHTVTHPILSTLDRKQQEREILGSRERIRTETGVNPSTIAFPNGSSRDYDPRTLEVLSAHGFRAACTTIRGSNSPGCEPFQLRRIGVGSDWTATLAARLSGLFDQ